MKNIVTTMGNKVVTMKNIVATLGNKAVTLKNIVTTLADKVVTMKNEAVRVRIEVGGRWISDYGRAVCLGPPGKGDELVLLGRGES